MGKKRTINEEFQSALLGKQIPLLILDQKWHNLFSDGGKPKKVLKLEKKANEYLRRQGGLNQDIKELKVLKEKLMKNIVANMDESGQEQESRRLKEDSRLISEINEKLRSAYAELQNLPEQLAALNQELMIETMGYCYEKMRTNELEIGAIQKWLEQIREEVKQKAVRKQTAEDSNREIYSYMHDIFGADIIEIFDLQYEKNTSKQEERQS